MLTHQEISKRGGKKTALRGPDYYRKIQVLGVKARLRNKNRLTIKDAPVDSKDIR